MTRDLSSFTSCRIKKKNSRKFCLCATLVGSRTYWDTLMLCGLRSQPQFLPRLEFLRNRDPPLHCTSTPNKQWCLHAKGPISQFPIVKSIQKNINSPKSCFGEAMSNSIEESITRTVTRMETGCVICIDWIMWSLLEVCRGCYGAGIAVRYLWFPFVSPYGTSESDFPQFIHQISHDAVTRLQRI